MTMILFFEAILDSRNQREGHRTSVRVRYIHDRVISPKKAKSFTKQKNYLRI